MIEEDRATINLAIGRILRLASRTSQQGDAAEYERCRRIVLDIAPNLPSYDPSKNTPNPGWNHGRATTGVIE